MRVNISSQSYEICHRELSQELLLAVTNSILIWYDEYDTDKPLIDFICESELGRMYESSLRPLNTYFNMYAESLSRTLNDMRLRNMIATTVAPNFIIIKQRS